MSLPEPHSHPSIHKEHTQYAQLNCEECMSDSVLLEEHFDNITVQKWGRICELVLQKVDIQILGDDGQGSAKGITIKWEYNQLTMQLALYLVHRSWYDPSIEGIDTDLKKLVCEA